MKFSRLGENTLRVNYGNGLWTTLEFFVTEPLETVIQKRAAFLAAPQQHKDPSEVVRRRLQRLGSEERDPAQPGRPRRPVGVVDRCERRCRQRPAGIHLASKNVFLPNKTEIESLELYISRYLWGGMQMTDKEKYPYAIYGIPNFRANRESADAGRNGQSHVWRIYDYPHIVMLYHRMYQIAKFYPDKITQLDAATYLERAYPDRRRLLDRAAGGGEVVGRCRRHHERSVHPRAHRHAREGRQERLGATPCAGTGRERSSVSSTKTPNLYGSEFAFDSTGFESTGAFAKYAMTHAAPPNATPAAVLRAASAIVSATTRR